MGWYGGGQGVTHLLLKKLWLAIQVRQNVTDMEQVAHGGVQGKHVGTPLADNVSIVVLGHED